MDAMMGMGAPAWNEPEDLDDLDRVVTPGPGRAFAGRVMMPPAYNLGAPFLSCFFVLSSEMSDLQRLSTARLLLVFCA